MTMFRQCLRRFVKREEGATAIEFALVSPIFLMLAFATIEVSWVYYATASVERSTFEGARLIRTAQAPDNDPDYEVLDGDGNIICEGGKECFFKTVCDAMPIVGDCNKSLSVDVQQFDSFAQLNANLTDTSCPDSNNYKIEEVPYQPGEQLSVVVVRVCYVYKPKTPGFGLALLNTNTGYRRVVATSIVRNEPTEDPDELGV